MPPGHVAMAAVVGAHGIGGEVRLKVFADDLGRHRSFNDGALTLLALRDRGIARFAEVRDRNAAEGLRGTVLTVARADLPPLADDEYYHHDLIGLAVVTDAGDPVGRIVAVENFGAGDLIDVAPPAGASFLVPVAAATIGEVATIPAEWVA